MFDDADASRLAADLPPLRPAPPLAKRLNRNALTVAAVIMGITVLTVVVVLRPGQDASTTRPTAAQAADETPPIPARPSFLDEPVRAPGTSASMPDTAPETAVVVGAERRGPSIIAANRDPDRAIASDAMGGFADPYSPPPAARTREEPSARQQAYLTAVASPVLAAASSSTSAPATPNPEAELLSLGDSILRSAARSATLTPTGGGGEPAAGPPPSPRAADARRAFLAYAGDTRGGSVIARLEPTGSPYTLLAGTVIPGILVTGINSDLPGDIVGQVSRDVYDSRVQRTLLIPKGSRLIGTYDNQVVAGQGRLLVAWTRLILPDGRSMRLPGLTLKDAQGQTGAKDKVDHHWRRVFGSALLLSAIGAGAQLSQPQQSSVLAPPSAGQVAAGALGQELSNLSLEIIRRGMDVAPTIIIRQGQPFNVFLNGDLVFDAPYVDAPTTAVR